MIDSTSTLSSLSRIALVDDNDYDNEYTRIILGKAGYTGELTVFHSGEEALSGLAGADHVIDLVFLDVNMPGMNGFEFAEELRRLTDGRPPPVVLLTSSSDPDDLQQAEAIDLIRAAVTKPLTPVSVVDVVARVAGSFADPLPGVDRP